jgi:hypothetical protein
VCGAWDGVLGRCGVNLAQDQDMYGLGWGFEWVRAYLGSGSQLVAGGALHG